jgi:hypothetical protein
MLQKSLMLFDDRRRVGCVDIIFHIHARCGWRRSPVVTACGGSAQTGILLKLLHLTLRLDIEGADQSNASPQKVGVLALQLLFEVLQFYAQPITGAPCPSECWIAHSRRDPRPPALRTLRIADQSGRWADGVVQRASRTAFSVRSRKEKLYRPVPLPPPPPLSGPPPPLGFERTGLVASGCVEPVGPVAPG